MGYATRQCGCQRARRREGAAPGNRLRVRNAWRESVYRRCVPPTQHPRRRGSVGNDEPPTYRTRPRLMTFMSMWCRGTGSSGAVPRSRSASPCVPGAARMCGVPCVWLVRLKVIGAGNPRAERNGPRLLGRVVRATRSTRPTTHHRSPRPGCCGANATPAACGMCQVPLDRSLGALRCVAALHDRHLRRRLADGGPGVKGPLRG